MDIRLVRLLDQISLTSDRESHFPSIFSYYLSRTFSDHAPIVLDADLDAHGWINEIPIVLSTIHQNHSQENELCTINGERRLC
jgi:hypothetical protein